MHIEMTNIPGPPPLGRLEALASVAVVGALGLVLGLVALAMPTSKTSPGAITYEQRGSFSYHGAAPATSVYGRSGVTSGQPILTNVVKDVEVRFDYRFTSSSDATVTGTHSLVAKVVLGQGLSRDFTIQPRKTFSGSTSTIAGKLPLNEILAYVRTSTNALQSAMMVAATVSVVPQIQISGSLGDRPIATSYAPALPFTLNGATTLALSQTTSSSPSSQNGGSSPDDVLTPSRRDDINFQTTRANTISLLFVDPSVTLARLVGFGVAAFCSLFALALGRPLMGRKGRTNERDRFRALYSSLLVPVLDVDVPDAALAEVASMGSLAELAKRYESMILHLRCDDRDEYMVWENGMLYRYTSVVTRASSTPAGLR